MDMQVSVGSPPGHGHSDIGHAGVSGQPPLDADSRTLDTQVSVDSPPGRGHSDIGHTGVSGQLLLDADIWILDMQVSVGIFLNGCVQICLEVVVFASISSPVILTPKLNKESS